MKKILILLLALIIGNALSAQNWTDVVYLKDGSIIKGTVIEQIPNVSVKIQTADGSVFVYEMSRVGRIAKEEILRPKNYRPNTYSSEVKKNEPYAGRKEENKFLLDIGAGIAPSTLGSSLNQDWQNTEYADLISFVGAPGFSLHLGGSYDQYFKKDSPWFYSLSLYGGWHSIRFNGIGRADFFPGQKVIKGSVNLWKMGASAGIGLQTQPNSEGMHLYLKAGAGINYVSAGNVKMKAIDPQTGATGSTQERDMSGISNFLFNPYGEIGLGNDAFFRIGIRYAPFLNAEIHCVTVNLYSPL